MADVTRLTDGQRTGLRIGGSVSLALGLILFVAGPLGAMGVFGAMPSGPEDVLRGAATSAGVFLVTGLLAMILVFAGATMLRFGFLKPVSEIVATETGGAVEHTAARVGIGLAGSRTGTGSTVREVVRIKCRGCGYLDSEDARFCSGCGRAM